MDPLDYEEYDDYVDAVLKKYEPINYDKWDRDSKKLLQSELTDFFIESRKIKDTVGERAARRQTIQEIAERKDRQEAGVSIEKKMRWQAKRQAKSKDRKVSKTTKNRVKSIRKKTEEGKKLNKTERKLKQSLQMSRSWELQQRFGYNRSDAMKRASKEFRM
jgi:hypothetical protein